MAYKKTAKRFYAEVDKTILAQFRRAFKAKNKIADINVATTYALKTFLALPPSCQADIIHQNPKDVLNFLGDYLLQQKILSLLEENVAPSKRLALIEKAIADKDELFREK